MSGPTGSKTKSGLWEITKMIDQRLAFYLLAPLRSHGLTSIKGNQDMALKSCISTSLYLTLISHTYFLCRNRFSNLPLLCSHGIKNDCPITRKSSKASLDNFVLFRFVFPSCYRPKASSPGGGNMGFCFSKVPIWPAPLPQVLLREYCNDTQKATTLVTDQGFHHAGNVPEVQTGKPKRHCQIRQLILFFCSSYQTAL